MANPIPGERFTLLNQLPLSLTYGNASSTFLNWGFIPAEPWRNYLHTHSFYEVCYAFAGRGTFRIHDSDHEVTAGDVFVAKPGEAHEIISSTEEPLGIYFWAYSLTLSEESRPHAGIDALTRAFTASTQPVSRRVPGMAGTIELLTQEIVQAEAGYPQIVAGLATKLLLDTSRAVVDPSPPAEALPAAARTGTDIIVDRILHYLHDNQNRPIAIRDVAAQVHLSERHTNRLFREARGLPIAEYLIARRMETAARMLLEEDLSIKEIAQRAGFRDVRYFTTVFRRRMGLPPNTFRRQNGTRRVADVPSS